MKINWAGIEGGDLGILQAFSGIFMGDRVYQPDDTKAYAEVRFCKAWPAFIPSYRTAVHAGTIANSYRSMLHQVVNISHKVRSYDPEGVVRDRIVGSVVDLDFPLKPENGWKVGALDQAPSIRAVLALFKQAEGMDRIMGKAQTGRSRWSVSQEFLYGKKESGFLFSVEELRGKPEAETDVMRAHATPDDFRTGGWLYVPWEKANEGIRGTYDGRVIKGAYKGVKPVLLAGGIDGQVHYHGIALTETPAEPAAELSQLIAEDEMGALVEPMRGLAEKLEEICGGPHLS